MTIIDRVKALGATHALVSDVSDNMYFMASPTLEVAQYHPLFGLEVGRREWSPSIAGLYIEMSLEVEA